MNDTPWWFAVITAVVAGSAAIAAQWISAWRTGRHANERLRQEHEVARQSRLYNRRVEVYDDLVRLAFEFTPAIAARREAKGDALRETQRLLTEKWELLYTMRARLFMIASAEVIAEFHRFAYSLHKIAGDLRKSEQETSTSSMEDIRLGMLRAMRRDLGAIEPLPSPLLDSGQFDYIAPLFAE
ncbi:hypothetical protein [Amycolatopsis sp. NPDC004079]|uniref:hypothetical protein n=1 Tax=Amycolatopsis sp. NPDC004079 TaxID=3154549 RepID=UPI00339FEF36